LHTRIAQQQSTGSSTPRNATGALFSGVLRVQSDDPDETIAAIDLGGWWQTEPEAGREPPLNAILEAFGFANRVDVAVLKGELYEKASPEEVLAPYWKLAPGVDQATVLQLAAFGDVGKSSFLMHAPRDLNATVKILQQDGLYNQSFLPLLSDASDLTKVFGNVQVPDAWEGDDWFGFRSSGNSSDPLLNKAPLNDVIRGHFVRFFEALDADGAFAAWAEDHFRCGWR